MKLDTTKGEMLCATCSGDKRILIGWTEGYEDEFISIPPEPVSIPMVLVPVRKFHRNGRVDLVCGHSTVAILQSAQEWLRFPDGSIWQGHMIL